MSSNGETWGGLFPRWCRWPLTRGRARGPHTSVPALVIALLAAAAWGPASADAQADPLPPTLPPGQDPYAAGRTDGFRAARLADDGIPVRMAGAAGGGFVAGVFGVIALTHLPDTDPWIPVAVGLSLVVGAETLGSALPPPDLSGELRERPPEYQRGFDDGYAESIRERRRSISRPAALTGAGVGALLLYFALQGYT